LLLVLELYIVTKYKIVYYILICIALLIVFICDCKTKRLTNYVFLLYNLIYNCIIVGYCHILYQIY